MAGLRTSHPALTREPPRQLRISVLDRLLDSGETSQQDRGSQDELAMLRRSVHRDLGVLLNTHQPWRSVPAQLTEVGVSGLHYGLPNFSSGTLNRPEEREVLRAAIEETIRRFEPRLSELKVHLKDDGDRLSSTLRLRIEAMLRVEPLVAPIVFDTIVNAANAETILQLHGIL